MDCCWYVFGDLDLCENITGMVTYVFTCAVVSRDASIKMNKLFNYTFVIPLT